MYNNFEISLMVCQISLQIMLLRILLCMDAYTVGNWTERVIRHAVIGYLLLNVFSH